MSRRATKETDRRSLYTKKAIKEAYLGLLDETPSEKVTIAEVCRRADINRGTFYLHYEDLSKLLEEMEDEAYEKLIAFVQQSLADEYNRQRTSDAFFLQIAQDKNIQKILYNSHYTPRLYEKILSYSQDLLTQLCVDTGRLNARHAELFSIFIVQAGFATARKFSEGTNQDILEDSAFVNKLIEAVFSAAIDLYAINEAYARRFSHETDNLHQRGTK